MFAIIGLLLCLFLQPQPSGAELYVSPSGEDSNPGTMEKPFRSFERARDAVREVRAGGALPPGGVTVWIAGGVYELSRTFELGPLDGGTRTEPVVYSALPGEEVRVSGARAIPPESFAPVGDRAVLARLPAEGRGKVLAADLRALGITDYGKHVQYGHGYPVVPAPMELFWNDTVLSLARYPNSGGILMGEVLDPGSVPRYDDSTNRGGTFLYTDPRHSRWVKASDVWFQGYFNHGFADDKIRVASIDTAARQIVFATPHVYGLASGQNFNLYVASNILEELDEPGEWYVDRSTGVVYLWPPGDPVSARVTVSVLEQPLVAVENTSFVVLKDLTFEGGRGLGVYIEGGEHNRIVGCTVRNVGTVGIMIGKGARQLNPRITVDGFRGVPVSREVGSLHSYLYHNTVWDRDPGSRHTIEACEVYNTGSGGIILGGGSKKELRAGGSAVLDSRIHDFDRRNKASAAGIAVDGCGNRVAHNEIYNGDLQAILVYGNEHLFEFNHIHHVARNSNDASAWYTGRDPSDQGNIVRHNFFHHVGRPDRKWIMGVYFDDAACGGLVEGNVFYRVASYGTVYSNSGHDLIIRNNIFIEGYGPVFQVKSMWYDNGRFILPYFFGEKGIYTKRLAQAVDITKPPYSERYPLLSDWLDLLPDGKTIVGMRPRRNVFERNVIVNYEETFRLVGEYAQCAFGKNYFSPGDPGFVDAGTMDFRLREDSEVFRELPGFRPIPFERMGPRPPSERR